MKFKVNPNLLFSTILLLVILLYLSCQKTRKTELEMFFESWSNNINAEKLNQFKLSPVDSVQTLEMISDEIGIAYNDVQQKERISIFLDSLLSAKNPGYQKIYLLIAFHEYLNGNSVYSPKVMTRLKEIWSNMSIKKVMENRRENEKIAKKNFDIFNVNDSLLLVFPIKKENGRKHTYFFQGYPYAYDYTSADDSLNLRVVLIDKHYGKKIDLSIDSSCLAFYVKIISLSSENIEMENGKKYDINEQFEFCLNDYGRLIEKE